MAEFLSFKEYIEESSSKKPGQPIGPPKKPRSVKALVGVPHKRIKGTKKPIGQPIPPPEAESPTAAKKMHESAAPKKKPEAPKAEKAVAVVVPQKTKIQKYLGIFKRSKGGGGHRGGYVRGRHGSISAPARKDSPKHFKMED